MSYLQKIKNIYYLVYKYRGKVIKKSLRNSNLKYCNIQKLKITQRLKKKLGLNFPKLQNYVVLAISASKGDDPKAVEELEMIIKFNQKFILKKL